MKPNAELWKRINAVIVNHNAGEALITLMSGMCAILVHAGITPDETSARAHLAAMLLSPDDGAVGSLLPFLDDELQRLAQLQTRSLPS